MTLLETWQSKAYDRNADQAALRKLWDEYFLKEKAIYEKLLSDPDTEVKGTVRELAEKYEYDIMTMVGFLDGINESLVEANPIETMDEDTVVSLKFDKEKLYMNMVEAEADWLYNLPQWEDIYTPEERKVLFRRQKDSHTIRKPRKIGRNDPCPCGSGKKYKNCCLKKDQAAEREAILAEREAANAL